MNVKVKKDLIVEPVSIEEAKLFCKVTGNDEDSLFVIWTSAARQALENYTQSSFGEKTILAIWNDGSTVLNLPYGPVISINKVSWLNDDGTETDLDINKDYWVYDESIKVSTMWSSGVRQYKAVIVEYLAGYDNTEVLPAALKLAILKQIATEYEMREDIAEGEWY